MYVPHCVKGGRVYNLSKDFDKEKAEEASCSSGLPEDGCPPTLSPDFTKFIYWESQSQEAPEIVTYIGDN